MEPANPPGDAGTWRDLERVRLRPLTESEHAVLREALAPVLRDIEASGAIQPAIEDAAHDDERAPWRCPRSRRVVCAIGALGRIPEPPGPDAAGR